MVVLAIVILVAAVYIYVFTRPEYRLAKLQISNDSEVQRQIGSIIQVEPNGQFSIETVQNASGTVLMSDYQFIVKGSLGNGIFEVKINTKERQRSIETIQLLPGGQEKSLDKKETVQ